MDQYIVPSEAPMSIVTMPFDERIVQFGHLRLIRAEWWAETPHFVLLKYAVDGHEQAESLRLDLDKRAIIDKLDDPRFQAELDHDSPSIWAMVVEHQRQLLGAV
jgi:hypothetical protein